jgi:YidC/Oxa1 family membrane protein insertase
MGPLSAPALLFALLLGGLVLVAFLLARKQTEGPAVLRWMPFGSVAFALVAPVGFTVYLLTTTSWTLLERGLLPRLA